MTPSVTALTRTSILNIHYALSNTCDGIERMFPFSKRDNSEWGSRYLPKSNVVVAKISFNWGKQSTIQCINIFTLEFFWRILTYNYVQYIYMYISTNANFQCVT